MSSNKEYKSTKEFNKAQKQRRKEWKEAKLLKKIKKQKVEDETVSKKTETIEVKPVSTISIAVPGSILDNAQSHELRTYLAGQIARAASIFQIDEIVVFDDNGETITDKISNIETENGVETAKRCCVQLARILQYLECPQYLRKYFFPIHNDLKFAGLLNPIDSPHHLRENDEFVYREGIVTTKPIKEGRGCYVNIGLQHNVQIEKSLNPGIRVTVKLLPQNEGSKKLKGELVAPNIPRADIGVYWGYSVRIAKNLAQIFSQCPYKEGYDLTIGTSDKGSSIDEISSLNYDHALIVFGGLKGLEAALENDEVLNTDDPSDLFDHYLNMLPNQGSRTIRTEEAILISMAALRTKLTAQNKLKNCVK